MRTLRIGVIALMLLIAVGPGQANLREWHSQYFTDSALNNLVGETTVWCDDTTSSWGVTADYIGSYYVNCYTEEVSDVSCYHWNGSMYEPVDCYWSTEFGGKIRVPIG